MTQKDFEAVSRFFEEYTERFISAHLDNYPYVLKKEHTLRVCANIEILGRGQNLSGEEMIRARTTALLHDLGRFRQYETWQTFSDPASADHGDLGVEEILKHGILDSFPVEEKRVILTAVQNHNVRHIPEGLGPKFLFLTRLVRDADKIDILRVMVAQYLQADPGKNGFIIHGRKDDGRISEELAEEVLREQSLDSRKVNSLNDLKLLHISWLFDLNFRESVRMIHERGYLETILGTMPESPLMSKLRSFIRDYIAGRISVRTALS